MRQVTLASLPLVMAQWALTATYFRSLTLASLPSVTAQLLFLDVFMLCESLGAFWWALHTSAGPGDRGSHVHRDMVPGI